MRDIKNQSKDPRLFCFLFIVIFLRLNPTLVAVVGLEWRSEDGGCWVIDFTCILAESDLGFYMEIEALRIDAEMNEREEREMRERRERDGKGERDWIFIFFLFLFNQKIALFI